MHVLVQDHTCAVHNKKAMCTIPRGSLTSCSTATVQTQTSGRDRTCEASQARVTAHLLCTLSGSRTHVCPIRFQHSDMHQECTVCKQLAPNLGPNTGTSCEIEHAQDRTCTSVKTRLKCPISSKQPRAYAQTNSEGYVCLVTGPKSSTRRLGITHTCPDPFHTWA